jgi:hypothetical protein
MANKAQQKTQGIQEFVVGQLEEARKQIVRFEKELAARGKQQRKELEGLISRVKSGKEIKALKSQANEVGSEVRKRLDGFQGKLVQAVGVASQSQVKEINRELSKLSKKLDALVGKKGVASVS